MNVTVFYSMRRKSISFLKRAIKKSYRQFPFKKHIFSILKKLNVPTDTFYRHLTFIGKIEVHLEDKSFYMFNYGGTIENEVFWKGIGNTWEAETLWLWIKLSKSSKIIFDIGANTGIYSLIAKTVNPSAKVFAFEPSEETFPKLVYNDKLNNTNIITEKIALSNESGTKIFYDIFEPNQTSASLSPDKLKNLEGYTGKMNEYKVHSETLADYIQKNNITHIDLMKIDVELHEPEVLEGFGNYLFQFKPTIIIEVLTTAVAEKLNTILLNSGYYYYHLERGKLQKVDKLFVVDKKWNFLLSPDVISLYL